MALFSALLDQILSRRPLLLYAAAWTALLTATVAVASFSPEVAFVSAISSSSAFTRECGGPNPEDVVRVPVDLPGEVVCLPAHLFSRSRVDLLVPPVFAAVVVAGSAFVVRALALGEVDDEARSI
ncbi:uncharacterized protein LOC104436464 [Eucalyptus grandis]|uniref:Uncharacterized protein n=3 Tax=Eucalyptus TaxID=3932 RepID=A0A059DEQ5_EUCGR|nr:uncharacterized protein LOC104436464 [Eucalyptus grandis]KAK3445270.1 hypothetical protein EUGRSUZ_A01246 [Eucalyptus grandis]